MEAVTFYSIKLLTVNVITKDHYSLIRQFCDTCCCYRYGIVSLTFPPYLYIPVY